MSKKVTIKSDCGNYCISNAEVRRTTSANITTGTEGNQAVIAITVDGNNNCSVPIFFDYDEASLKSAQRLVKLIKDGINA